MNPIYATKSNTFIIGWVAALLGLIMNGLFNAGFHNIGVCIILFTVIVNILMLPLTIKQQKTSKLTAFMQPEIQAIQKKYKGKTDQQSQSRMQAETQAVYEKYGTSMTGGCGQLLIQFPILIALYQVIYRIPGYVTHIKEVYSSIAEPLMAQSGYYEKLADLLAALKNVKLVEGDPDSMIDFLYRLNPAQMDSLKSIFPAVSGSIDAVAGEISQFNTFLGLNLSMNPWQGFKPNWAWSIPILAAVTQWLSAKLMMQGQEVKGQKNEMQEQMKTMNAMMPLMSLVFCFTLPTGIGIYWIASAVVRTIIQFFINKKYENVDVEDIVKENLEKVNKKRARKGLPPKTVDKKAQAQAAKEERETAFEEAKAAERREKSSRQVIESTQYYNFDAKPDSITARANMVAAFEKREWEKKTGKKLEVKKVEKEAAAEPVTEQPAEADTDKETANAGDNSNSENV